MYKKKSACWPNCLLTAFVWISQSTALSNWSFYVFCLRYELKMFTLLLFRGTKVFKCMIWGKVDISCSLAQGSCKWCAVYPGAATVRIAMPAHMQSSLIFHYNLKFYDSDGDGFDGVSLKRFVMQVGDLVLSPWNEISCTNLQLPPEPLTRGLPPPDPHSLCHQLNLLNPPPNKIPGYATGTI